MIPAANLDSFALVFIATLDSLNLHVWTGHAFEPTLPDPETISRHACFYPSRRSVNRAYREISNIARLRLGAEVKVSCCSIANIKEPHAS
jgi:hypothetical protein